MLSLICYVLAFIVFLVLGFDLATLKESWNWLAIGFALLTLGLLLGGVGPSTGVIIGRVRQD